MTERFLAAALGGDLDALMELLAPDVTLWGDGGGKAQRPACGRCTAGTRSPACSPRSPPAPATASTSPTGSVNGDPSALLFAGDTPYAVLVLDLTPDGDQVCGIYAVTNPDKLSHVD